MDVLLHNARYEGAAESANTEPKPADLAFQRADRADERRRRHPERLRHLELPGVFRRVCRRRDPIKSNKSRLFRRMLPCGGIFFEKA